MLQKYRKYKSKLMNRVEAYRPNKNNSPLNHLWFNHLEPNWGGILEP
jgi:hypothetical protein